MQRRATEAAFGIASRIDNEAAVNLRAATLDDVPTLRALIELSARELSAAFYSPQQIDAAVVHVFGVDTQLIRDGTDFVIEAGDELAAAGGWSARRTLYGGDQTKVGSDPGLDPRTEAARIRAFFVHPRWARQGFGRQLYATCARAAWDAGFRHFELMATRPGEPLYVALGFTVVERVVVTLPDGVDIPFARMSRAIDPPATEIPQLNVPVVPESPWRAVSSNDRAVAGGDYRRLAGAAGRRSWRTGPETPHSSHLRGGASPT